MAVSGSDIPRQPALGGTRPAQPPCRDRGSLNRGRPAHAVTAGLGQSVRRIVPDGQRTRQGDLLRPPDRQCGVLAPEGDTVGHGILKLQFSRRSGDVIQIALRVGFIQIDRGVDDAVPHS